MMINSSLTPRTVLMTADTVGGVWTYAIDLARSLSEHGVRVVLAAMGSEPSPSQLVSARAVDRLVLESAPYKLEWMRNAWEDVRMAGEWLLELESDYRPDIIHLNGYVHGAQPWSAPVLIVGHSCVCSWFYAVKGEAPPADWQIYRRLVREGLRAADAVTAPTDAMLSELRRHYRAFRGAGAIYNARRSESFKSPRAEQYDTRLGEHHKKGPGERPFRGSREPFVLTAGRLWDEAKNVGALDAAAGSIRWPVLAAGPVRNPDGGEIHFESLRLVGCLSAEDMASMMNQASIYVLPARYEPFGLTVLEAALAGCALVVGDIPSLREVWEDAACYVPPTEPAAIAAVVNDLTKDPRRIEAMARRAGERAQQFSPDRMVSAYLRLYARLLARREGARKDRPALAVAQQASPGSVTRSRP